MLKRKLAIVLVITILLGLGVSHRAEARTEVTLDLFFEALSPYGEWIEHDYYGYIWQPVGVDPYWKPYSDGDWVYSDEGWIWVSNEPWGWATYHYGRWVPDDYYGWVWIPGVTWAPEYVEWYESPGYIGWAPRPPDTSFFLEIGITIGSGYGYYGPYYYYDDYYYEPYYYGGAKHHKKHYRKHRKEYYSPDSHSVYVPTHQFSHKNAKLVALDGPQNLVVHRNAKNISKQRLVNNRIVDRGPDRHSLERSTGKKIQRVNVVERPLTQVRGGKNVNHLRGGEYNVYRPQIVKDGRESPRRISKRSTEQGNLRGASTPGLERGRENSSSRSTDTNRNGNSQRTDNNRTRTYRSGASGKYTEVKNDERKNLGAEKSYSGGNTNRGVTKRSGNLSGNGNKNKQKPERARNAQLSPSKSYKTHTTRQNKTSADKQNYTNIERSGSYTNRAKRGATQFQSQSSSQRNTSVNTNRSAKREPPGNVRKSRPNANRVKPDNTANKISRQSKSYERSGTYKSQPRPGNNGRQYQKSGSSNKAQKSVNSRSVKNGGSVRSTPNKSITRSTPSRSVMRSPQTRSYNNRGISRMRQTGNNSFNRHVRR